jgi:hypothetical protein
MAEICLNEAKVEACLKQMRSPAVSEGMNAGALLNAALDQSGSEGVLNAALVNRDRGKSEVRMGAPLGRKNENGIAMSGPELPEQVQSSGRKRDKAIFCALAVSDVDHGAISIDVLNLKMSPLLKSKAAGVDGRETETVAGNFDEEKNASNFTRRKNDRKLLFFGRANEVESGQLFVKNVFEKEADATKSDGGGTARVFLDVSEVKEILSKFEV